MQETFDRVTERHGGKTAPVKHFYRRQYQIAGGEPALQRSQGDFIFPIVSNRPVEFRLGKAI
jgi:hypothetical protein